MVAESTYAARQRRDELVICTLVQVDWGRGRALSRRFAWYVLPFLANSLKWEWADGDGQWGGVCGKSQRRNAFSRGQRAEFSSGQGGPW